MTTYNGELFLSEQLESLLQQTETRWHLYVSDDGSTDNTRVVLQRYIRRYPDKIIDVSPRQPFHNVSRNFSHALEYTKAPYLMFADQDDVWHPDKIARTWAVMKAIGPTRPGLVHTDLTVVDADRHVIAPSYWHYAHLHPTENLAELLFQNVVTGCTIMMTRTLLEKAWPFPDGIFMYDWWLAWVASQFGTLRALPEPTIDYRQHTANVVGAQSVVAKHLWNPGTWWEFGNQLRQSMQRRLVRTRTQAIVFRQWYAADLTPGALALVDDYIALPSLPFWRRRIAGYHNRFFAHSWQTRWGMWLLL